MKTIVLTESEIGSLLTALSISSDEVRSYVRQCNGDADMIVLWNGLLDDFNSLRHKLLDT